MKRRLRLYAAGLFLLLTNGLTAQSTHPSKVEIIAEAVPKSDSNKLRLAIQLLFQIDGKNRTILLPKEGAPFDPESYSLVDDRGGKVPVTPVIDKDVIEKDPPPLLRSISLFSAQDLDRARKYILTVKPAVLVFQVGTNATDKAPNSQVSLAIDGDTFGPALDYVEKRQTGQSKVEIGGGTPGGVASAEVVFDRSQFLHVGWMNLRIKGTADVTLNGADRRDFFNSLSAEAMFYRPIRFANNYSEIAVSGKTESDQQFDIVNAGAGIKWAWFARNKPTDWLGHTFVKDAVSVPPLLVFSYDSLESVKRPAGSTPASAASRDHHHRGAALLRYRLPISSQLDLSRLPALGGKFDLFADFEIKGVYDGASDRIHDQSRISLIFEPSTGPDRFKPALSLSWARGKAAPTFQQISALLVGFRLSF